MGSFHYILFAMILISSGCEFGIHEPGQAILEKASNLTIQLEDIHEEKQKPIIERPEVEKLIANK